MLCQLKKPPILLMLMLAGLSLLCWQPQRANSAPKATSPMVLQPLFAETRFANVTGTADMNGSISYDVVVNKSLNITVQEVENGYAWIWCTVAKFDSAPPAGMFRKLAELNDTTRLGALSWYKDTAPNATGGVVYYNYFFLMRVTDAKALEEYINTAAVDHARLSKELRDFLP